MDGRTDARFWPDRMAALAALARADGLALIVDVPGVGYRTQAAHNVPDDTRWGDRAAATVVGRAIAQRAPGNIGGVAMRLVDGRVADGLAVVPVVWKDQLAGGLAALFVSRSFTPEDAVALVRVAAVVGVEIAEEGVSDEDRRQALALYELSRFATLAADPAADLDSATRMLAAMLRHDVVGVWVVDDEGLRLRAAAGDAGAPRADLVPIADTTLAQVLRERRTVAASFGPTDKRPDWAPATATHFLLAPIGRARAGVVLGALVLGRAAAPYVAGDEDLAAMVGEYLAGMLQKGPALAKSDLASERRRIAQELHDGIAQELTGVVLALEGCQRAVDTDPPVVRSQLAKAARDARATLSDVRQYMAALRQAQDTGELNLQVTLARLVDDIRAHNGVRVELSESGARRPLDPIVERAVIRVATEALRNVALHSGATSAKLALRYDDDQIVLVVEDEGQGFDVGELDTAEERGHYGIVGIRERAEGVGGELIVRSERGKGTVVRASIPYRESLATPTELVVQPAPAPGEAETVRGDKNVLARLLGR